MAKYFLATIVFILFGFLLMPSPVSAAYNTVQFDADSNIYLEGAGQTLVISSGGAVAGMTIYSTYVDFDMESGSSVTITSYARKTLTNDLGVATDCLENYSQITLTSASTQTVTVTPGDVCGGGGGGGAAPADTTPPSISNIEVIAADTTTTITWQTDEASLTWLVYGTTTDYGLEVKGTSFLTSHSVTLENLTPETTYHYQIKSEDSSGNVGSYADQTFTTLAQGQVPEEVVEEVVEEEEIVEKPISEMTIEEIKAKILEIQQKIIELLTQLIQLIQSQIAELQA